MPTQKQTNHGEDNLLCFSSVVCGCVYSMFSPESVFVISVLDVKFAFHILRD